MPGEGYDPKITLKKFFYGYLTSLIGILFPFTLSYVQEFDWPTEMLIYIPIVLAVLYAAQNAWSHWNDPAPEED
jgi:hypothetical protein